MILYSIKGYILLIKFVICYLLFMKKINFKKGFTLIEVLVAIIIIGILASITLGYIGGAKKTGDNTAVKSNLHTTKLAAENFFLENGGSYLLSGGSDFTPSATCPFYSVIGTNMFSRNKVIADSIAEAVKRGSGSACYSTASSWAVAVSLKSSATTSWCVDTSGVAKMVSFAPLSAISAAGACL